MGFAKPLIGLENSDFRPLRIAGRIATVDSKSGLNRVWIARRGAPQLPIGLT